MKAAVLNAVGDDKLELRDDVTTVEPGATEVKVAVRTTGICHSDLSAMDGTLPALAPGIPGHEGAGEVVAVGSAVQHLVPGDRVTVSFVPPCNACNACLRGQPHLCGVHPIEAFMKPRFLRGEQPLFGYAGLGTFAEELVVPGTGAIKIAEDVPFEVGSLIACGILTGAGAVLNTAKVEPGSSVAIIGCGGVGIAAIQGARIAGATTIVAVDPVEAKHPIAKHFGATHTVTPADLEASKQELTASEGFDYVFDIVGAPATIRTAWDQTRRGGTTVVVGAGRGDQEVSFSAQELFLHEKRLLGSFYGSAHMQRDTNKMVNYWRAGLLNIEGMISRRIQFDEINDGLATLRDGQSDVIRQVVTVG